MTLHRRPHPRSSRRMPSASHRHSSSRRFPRWHSPLLFPRRPLQVTDLHVESRPGGRARTLTSLPTRKASLAPTPRTSMFHRPRSARANFRALAGACPLVLGLSQRSGTPTPRTLPHPRPARARLVSPRTAVGQVRAMCRSSTVRLRRAEAGARPGPTRTSVPSATMCRRTSGRPTWSATSARTSGTLPKRSGSAVGFPLRRRRCTR